MSEQYSHNDAYTGDFQEANAQCAARNACLDALLDPNGQLPEIVLQEEQGEPLAISFDDLPEEEHQPSAVENRRFRVHSKAEEEVGYMVTSYNPEERRGHIRDVRVYKRGEGYGPAVYLTVLKSLPLGSELATQGRLSDDAVRVWEGLVSKGIAVRVESQDEVGPSYVTTLMSL